MAVEVKYHVGAFTYKRWQSKFWARKLEDVDLSQQGGYAFKGPWLKFSPSQDCLTKRISGLKEDDFFVLYAEVQTKWLTYSVHGLFRVITGGRYVSETPALSITLTNAESVWLPNPERIKEFSRNWKREMAVRVFERMMNNFNWAIALWFDKNVVGRSYPF